MHIMVHANKLCAACGMAASSSAGSAEFAASVFSKHVGMCVCAAATWQQGVWLLQSGSCGKYCKRPPAGGGVRYSPVLYPPVTGYFLRSFGHQGAAELCSLCMCLRECSIFQW